MKKILLTFIALSISLSCASKAEDGTWLAQAFQQEVARHLEVPPEAHKGYVPLLETALLNAQVEIKSSQYVLLLDRNPHVQAVLLYWFDAQASSERWHFIGAAPASTGKPGGFEHFITPLGVYAHTLDNKDFRAEGTFNKNGVRSFGLKGMRVYDFGWAMGERTWGNGGLSQMRLLVHATDPDLLERHLGEPMSKGCIRIPATLNIFIDQYGILDADYEQAQSHGKSFWVLRPDRTPTPWSGRYLVIVDSASEKRPAWSPQP